MNIGIIGSGAAAKRLFQILKTIDKSFNINLYSKKPRSILIKKKIINLKGIFFQKKTFYEDLFFIANNTADHFKYISILLKKNKPIYVEKPLCTSKAELNKIKILLKSYKKKLFVGYQFRENKCLRFLKKEILMNKKNIYYVTCYSGENVKKYHKNENYLNSYTLSKKKGGGVILTQSHQIDYLNFLFGKIKDIKAIKSDKNNLLNLKTTVDTNITYICKTNDEIPISCNINYFGLTDTFIFIYFKNKIIRWNCLKNFLIIETTKKNKKIVFNQSRIDMFKSRIKYFLKNYNKPCSKKDLKEIFESMENILKLKSIIK
jgi:CMP-N,N'-diacetyllegionaminic acid synthase